MVYFGFKNKNILNFRKDKRLCKRNKCKFYNKKNCNVWNKIYLDWFNRIMEMVEERISEFEGRLIKLFNLSNR